MTNLISSFSPGADQNSFTGYLGMQFGLPIGYSIHVNSLGIRCATGDTGPHNVYLLNGTTTVASAVVDLTGGTVGTFYYTSITPVTLTGAGPFNILTQVTSGGQNCSLPGPTTLTSGAACITSYTTSLSTAVTTVVAAQQYVGLDLTYVATFDNATSNLVQGSTTSSWSADPTIVFGFAPTPGNLIVAMDAGDGNNPNTAAWTQFGYAGSGAGNMRYVYRYVQPGDTTVLPPFQIPATTAYAQAAAWEIAGAGPTWALTLDQYQNTQGSGSSFSTSTLTTATPNELGLVFVVADELGPSGPPTIASPWISNGGLIGHIYSGSFGQLAFSSVGASVSATGNFPAGFNDEQIGVVLLVFADDLTITATPPKPVAVFDMTASSLPSFSVAIAATTGKPMASFVLETEAIDAGIVIRSVTVPSFTASQFATAIAQLLPRGRAWPRELTSNMMQAVASLAPPLATFANRAANLLIDAFPATTVELLPDWQKSLSLPDPCSGPTPLLQLEQAQVVARFVGDGGQDVPYLIRYARNLGYTITITEFTAFQAGISTAGTPLYDAAWANALQINAALTTIAYFRAGESTAGEPLQAWGNATLECEMARIVPAQAILLFSYS